jgi:hypothetical protein
MNYPQILLLGALIMVAAILAAILFAAAMKIALTTGVKEIISHYIQKKKEAIEQLEQQFGDGSSVKPIKQKWDA